MFRVFERSGGEFYSIHGKDTQVALKTTLKSSILVKNMSPDDDSSLVYASFNKNIFEKLLKELLVVIGYKVEVYTTEKGEWSLEYKGSPGNLSQFEDLLFNSSDPEVLSSLLMALQLVTSQQQKVKSQT